MRMMSRLVRVAAVGMIVAACSVNPVTYTGLDGGPGGDDAGIGAGAPVVIGGTVTGLTGSGLVLANRGETLAISANGGFTFATTVPRGESYAVTVQSQPTAPLQQCAVSNGSGTAGSADVTSVQITCDVVGFTVGGTIEGLAGSGLMLQNSGGDTLAVTANGTFTFPTSVPSGGRYGIEVVAQPGMPTQACVVTGASGDVVDANITSVAITCQTRSFLVGGTVTGLLGSGLVLLDNGGDDLSLAASGAFAFTTPVLSGTAYNVTIRFQPSNPAQTCTVSGGTGTVGGGDVTSVTINCSTRTFAIGGTVTGLTGSGLVLQDNSGDDLAISGTGTFAFATAIASGATYRVTVRTQPLGPSQTCAVSNASGTVGAANVSNVAVSCTTNSFSIGGSVTGLAAGDKITLRDNGGDALVVSANGGFTFATKIVSGQSYAVTTDSPTSPIVQSCTVANASGVVGAADVTNVAVTCTTRTFTIGGTVRGLSGTGLVLQDNGGDDLAIAANGGFTFGKAIASGATYNVTVKASPAGTQCSASASFGTVVASNITSVVITCVLPWSPSLFPLVLGPPGNAVGGFALDNNGDLLAVQGFAHTLYRVKRLTGEISVVATNIGDQDGSSFALSVAYRAATDTLYVSTYRAVYTVSASGTVALLTTSPLYLATIAFAPPSFGNYGGFLIGATQGNVVAIDPDTGAQQVIASPDALSGLVFAPDGTLYVSGVNTLWKIAADGTATPLLSTLNGGDGLTVTPDGQRMFVANYGTQSVLQVSLPGLAVSTLAADVAIDVGFAPAGILALPGNLLIVITNPNNTIRGFGY